MIENESSFFKDTVQCIFVQGFGKTNSIEDVILTECDNIYNRIKPYAVRERVLHLDCNFFIR